MRTILLLILLLLCPLTAVADQLSDSTESPFFLVTSELAGTVDVLPLKATEVEVAIAGVIAEVVVRQRYVNTGSVALEAVYVFPGSTRAAVHGMQMRIGERIRKAKIQRKARARATYEKAKKEGKSASLLEQKRPNVFQMNVANIMPGDAVEVELRYTELLVATEGMYQFVYPTVVGPRYASEENQRDVAQEESWIANPYTAEAELPSYTFALDVSLNAGMPVQKIASSSHQIAVDFQGATQAQVQLDPSEVLGGNRDFILSYQLQGEKIQSGLLLYEGEKENFFLLMAQPPKRVQLSEVPPREYIFVVDVSGSMRGFPLEVSKSVLKELVANLRPQDRFNVLLFAGASALLAPESLIASDENIQEALNLIDRQAGGGGTELLPALRRIKQVKKTAGVSRTVVVVTDGYISAETESFDIIRESRSEMNVFTFGIGSSVNRFLIEGLARVGLGEPFVVTQSSQAPYVADRFREYIESPLLTDIEIQYDGFEAYDVVPATQSDLFAQRPLIVFGKYKGEARGSIRISGSTGAGGFYSNFNVDEYAASRTEKLEALRYLWARSRIAMLSDYNAARSSTLLKEEITELGLEFSLLTKYTSFIAVDELVRNPKAEGVQIQQALPLPQGVSNAALGASQVPSVPEPEFYALLLMLGLSMALFYREQLVSLVRTGAAR